MKVSTPASLDRPEASSRRPPSSPFSQAFLEAVRAQTIPQDLIPTLAAANVPYYDGCLIVELVDHRPKPLPPSCASNAALAVSLSSSSIPNDLTTVGTSSEASSSKPPPLPPSTAASTSALTSTGRSSSAPVRIVLHPSPGSVWTDVCMMNEEMGGNWDDFDALQLEARILVSLYYSFLSSSP
jgi:transcription factor SPT20